MTQHWEEKGVTQDGQRPLLFETLQHVGCRIDLRKDFQLELAAIWQGQGWPAPVIENHWGSTDLVLEMATFQLQGQPALILL